MITPAFALNFTTASLDSRVTFTRVGNTATRVNDSGLVAAINADLPRFDYDPVTLVCKGLLIEESRINIVLYSEQLDNGNWNKSDITVSANAITSPDGTVSADKVVENSATALHLIGSSNNSITSGQSYAFSFYAKAGERSVAQILPSATAFGFSSYANFNLNTGVVSASAVGTASIQNAGNGWYRCMFVVTATSTAVTGAMNITLQNSPTAARAAAYAGNGTSGLYIWGAQIEAGAFPTSYIPTVAATVTRNADVATITGTNFSDFWQAGKGGAQVQAIPSTVSGIRPLVQYDDGTANEIIALRGNTTNPELYIVDDGTPQAQLDAGTIAANTAYSLTGWWQTNDCKARKDSGAVVTDEIATIPTVTQARLGSDGTNYLNGHLATINYYDSFFGQSIYTRRKNKVIFSLL